MRDLIPQDSHSAEDLDDWLTTIGTGGSEVLEGQSSYLPRPSKKTLQRHSVFLKATFSFREGNANANPKYLKILGRT